MLQDVGMWLLGALVLLSGVGVVAAPSAVYAALFLTLNLLGIAVLFLTLSSQFMAVAQLLIYAGAVMVVFLFAVTVLAPDDEVDSAAETRPVRLGGLTAGGLLALGLATTLVLGGPVGGSVAQGPGTAQEFAMALFGRFLLPFEGTAFLLLVALMAAVILGVHRGRK
ncbi:MAG: NADH-quinone oxidoreductase subunit J [Vulcanimicrobiota bacterium]